MSKNRIARRGKKVKFSNDVRLAFTANRAQLIEHLATQPEPAEPLAVRFGRLLAQNRRSILLTASDGKHAITKVLEDE
jgi:hypothetical protein